jgi:hypothetical protein
MASQIAVPKCADGWSCAILADPLSGEGIRAAIFSGFKIARSIELLEMPATPRKQYTQTIAQESN